MTMAERVLRFIAESPNGRRLGEISKFIYENNYPEEVGATRKTWRYNYRTGGSKQVEVPAYRGYWGTNLTGNPSTMGILESFCIKTPDRRYVVVEPIKPPFFRRHGQTPTETYNLNRAKRTYDYLLKKALAPKCKGCGEPMTWQHEDEHFTRDGQAHFVQWSTMGWKSDCKKRVWLGTLKQHGSLTKLTVDQVTGMADCMRNKGAHHTLIEDTIHRFVLDNAVVL